MWVKILKYAIKAAIASGVANKGVAWLKGKFVKAADKAVDKLATKAQEIVLDKEEMK